MFRAALLVLLMQAVMAAKLAYFAALNHTSDSNTRIAEVNKTSHNQSPYLDSFGEVCYEDLGCFANGGKFFDIWYRPVFLLPQSPDKMNMRYLLFTRSNRDQADEIFYNNELSLFTSEFRARRDTKIVTHGFTDGLHSGWMEEMKDRLLEQGDYNVILMEWSGGNGFPYSQATVNTRVVGAILARILTWIENKTDGNIASYHVIGHSLGAHIAGYAGERLLRLGRITAMDPAGPYFESMDSVVRVDESDALFVDVIHTDAAATVHGGFGLHEPVGHVDFYPNGGIEQPGCTKNPIVSITEHGRTFSITCYHTRVMPLMIESVAAGAGMFRAVQCDSYDAFLQGSCTCATNQCASLGLYANAWRPNGQKRVVMYVDTSDSEPFYTKKFIINLQLSDSSESQRNYGDILVRVADSSGLISDSMKLAEDQHLEAGSQFRSLFTVDQTIPVVSRISIEWLNKSNWNWGTRRILIDRVEVVEWSSQRRTTFCGNDQPLTASKTAWLESNRIC